MNELQDILDFVGAFPPFGYLDRDSLTALCRGAEISYHRRGDVVLAHHVQNQELMLVRRGAVGIYADDARFIEKRAEGEVFGYPALITGRPTRFEVRAEEDTLLYRFPERAFRDARAGCAAFDRYFSLALIEKVPQVVEQQSEVPQAGMPVRDLMSSPPVVVPADTPINAAAARMTREGISSVLVELTDGSHGIVTDRDLRSRVVAEGRDIGGPVGDVASTPLVTISPDESVMEALLLMTDRNLHHLAVADGGEAIGMLSASDVSRADNSQPVYYVRAIRREETPEDVVRAARRRTELFVNLARMGVSANHIGRIMSTITDAITQRCIELTERQLGPPPMAYAWLAFGSQARREQTVRTDQDNGLLLADEPDRDAQRWFAQLAERVCDSLNAAGIVHCPGAVMANNPSWCQPLSAWRGMFAGWMKEPEPKPLMHASIFFDLRFVSGDRRLVEELAAHVFERAPDNRIFLRFMAQNALSNSPPLGFFRRFILEPDGQHSEGLNLKRRGVAPIIALARVRALEHGLREPGTFERLSGLSRLRPNAARDLANLREAYELVEKLRISHQADQLRAGATPTNFVDPVHLSALSRDHLRAAFEAVRTAQRALERRFLLG